MGLLMAARSEPNSPFGHIFAPALPAPQPVWRRVQPGYSQGRGHSRIKHFDPFLYMHRRPSTLGRPCWAACCCCCCFVSWRSAILDDSIMADHRRPLDVGFFTHSVTLSLPSSSGVMHASCICGFLLTILSSIPPCPRAATMSASGKAAECTSTAARSYNTLITICMHYRMPLLSWEQSSPAGQSCMKRLLPRVTSPAGS